MIFRRTQDVAPVRDSCGQRFLGDEDRVLLGQRITEIESWLNPPIFDRPRGPRPQG